MHAERPPPLRTVKGEDFGDATQEIATVLQSGLGLPDRDFYLNEDPKSAGIREKYTAHGERVFLLLGDKPERAKAEAEFDDRPALRSMLDAYRRLPVDRRSTGRSR